MTTFLIKSINNDIPKINKTLFSQKIIYLGSILLIGLGVNGCNSLLLDINKDITPIIEIKENRRESTLNIKGLVENQAPFIGSGAYLVKDATGTIWVFTNQTLPKTGEQITVKGKVKYEKINVENQQLGEVYLEEMDKIINVQ